MTAEMLQALAVAGITGGISSGLTIAGLRVHIIYLRETLTRHESAISRAHSRIDQLTTELHIMQQTGGAQ